MPRKPRNPPPVNPALPFGDITLEWFNGAFGGPTPVQEAAWPRISAGCDTLVSAPTGTGKTLSAFLVFIDRLAELSRRGKLEKELYLIYISPLKSLAGDIRENLRKPIDGIALRESRQNDTGGVTRVEDLPGASRITIGIRTGDSTSADRRAMFKNPPNILITTPESLYILLTSLSGVRMLKSAGAVIIDELHALIGSKRGAHLMLSLARLDLLHGAPLQRIGLSATIEPLELAAKYLSPNGAAVVSPKSGKAVELTVDSAMPKSGVLPHGTIWPEIAREVYKACDEGRCVIAFVESRMHAEKLSYHVNLIAGEGFALAHHGSVSKERRLQAEQALREGRLRLLCATSSMELGIDVGDIDRVIQIGCPRTVSSTLQRLGRAGHNPGRVSVMKIIPRTPAEGIICGVTAELARNGEIEPSVPPGGCLDVLAQHLVSMASAGEYTVDNVMAVTARAYPFAALSVEQVGNVLKMLAGDYEHEIDIPVRPRILYDRINGRVRGDAYSRMLALSAGGTIPDRGLFTVRGENGVRYGEVDEEFVFEARVGDKFLLGAFAWRIQSITHDEVVVTQSGTEGVQPPFWKGEITGRGLHSGLAYGKLMREISEAAITVKEETDSRAYVKESDNPETDKLDSVLYKFGLDPTAAEGAKSIIMRQIEATGALPDDRTLIVEHFHNEAAEHQLVIHSVFGKRINSPLALLARDSARRMLGSDVGVYDDDDGFLLFPVGGKTIPEGLLYTIDPSSVRRVLSAMLPATPLFSIAFRYNAARALMMGVRKRGRQPLWIQRQRSAKLLDQYIAEDGHPLIGETTRECMEDYWDVPGLEYVVNSIRSGVIAVREINTGKPSPLSLPLRRAVESDLMYDYTPIAPGVKDLTKAAVEAAILQGTAITPGLDALRDASKRERIFADTDQLHTLLMTEGDQLAGEAEAPIEWFEELARTGRAGYIEPGLWIASEHAGEYALAFSGTNAAAYEPDSGAETEARANGPDGDGGETASPAGYMGGARELENSPSAENAKRHIVRRMLRYHGGHTADMVSDRYSWPDAVTREVLDALAADGDTVLDGEVYYHAEVYERARRNTVMARRAIIKTQPPERYAALLAGRVNTDAAAANTAVDRVIGALRALRGQAYPAALWESALLPGRVSGYRPESLDAALARGEFFWTVGGDASLSFHAYEDIDWENDFSPVNGAEGLDGDERIIYDSLKTRGALFTQGLAAALGGRSPYDALLALVEKGVARSDSFIPIRQLLDKDKFEKVSVRQRAQARAQMLTSGRWELARGVASAPMALQLPLAFERAVILCRETAPGLPWLKALEVLRVWEYTGQVRRGYYVEGLSGAQFVRDEDFAFTTAALARADAPIVWLPAADPAQPWGKSLRHMPGRAFMNIPGNAVCLRGGVPIMVFERQGQALRILGETAAGWSGDSNAVFTEALKVFTGLYSRRRLFGARSSLIVKQYPAEAAGALIGAGFTRYMQDYVLYR